MPAIAALAVAAIASLSAPARAQFVILNDGFESYALGALDSQGLWQDFPGIGFGSFIVSSPVQSGSRALLVSLDPNPPNPVGTEPRAFFQFPCPSRAGTVEIDVRKETNSSDYAYVILREGSPPTDADRFDVIFIFGDIRYLGTSPYPFNSFSPPVSFNAGQWYHVRIDWYANSTADVSIDHVLRGSGLPFRAPMTTGVNALALNVGPDGMGSGENAWYDNAVVRIFDECPTGTQGGSWGQLKRLYR